MLLASGARDASVCVWNLEQRRCALRITGHRAPVSGVAFVDGRKTRETRGDRHDAAAEMGNHEVCALDSLCLCHVPAIIRMISLISVCAD